MSNENKSEPAFPCELKNISGGPIIGFTGETIEAKGLASYGGMTLRDYFAATCPITWTEAQDYNTTGADEMMFFVTIRAQYADAMLAERAK